MKKKTSANDKALTETTALSEKDTSSRPMPFLVFGLKVELLEIHGANRLIHTERERKEVERMFLKALRRGDRNRFAEYCGAKPNHDTVPCEIFSLNDLPKYRYAFCKKSTSVTEHHTIVFLAEDVGQIRCLMSPASLSPSVCGRQIIYELLSFFEMSDAAAEISISEDIISSRMFPTLIRSLISVGNERAPCDIVLLTETAMQSLGTSPVFLNTVIKYHNTVPDTDVRIIELSASLYIHILTSFLTVLTTLSVNHTIELSIRPFVPCTVDAHLGAEVRVCTAIKRTDEYGFGNFSPKMLTPAGTTNEILLSAASVLACIAGIDTSARYDYQTGMLTVSLTINSESGRANPDFKYRNPYFVTRDVIADFMSALPNIDSLGNGIYFKKRGRRKK